MALIWCHFKPSPTHVICYNSNLLSHPQPHDHHLGEDHLDDDHLVDVNESESLYVTREKHCLVVKHLCHKHLIIMMVMVRLLVVIIVIKVVKIIMIVPSQESNNKSEFNNCISTETAESFYEVCD